MNENEQLTAGGISNPTPTKPKRTRKPKARAARVIDPEVKAIRERAKEDVRQLKLARNSNGVLTNITTKMLPKLTTEHRRMLRDHLNAESLSTASAPEQAGPVTGIN